MDTLIKPAKKLTSLDPCPAQDDFEHCPLPLTTHRATDGAFCCDKHGYRKVERAVTFLYQYQGKILSVSRGNNLADLGLPGGKVEKDDKSDWSAIIREVQEETGLVIADVIPVFTEWAWETKPLRVCTTFVGRVDSPLKVMRNSPEGVVQFVWPNKLVAETCSFRHYNRALFKALGIVAEE